MKIIALPDLHGGIKYLPMIGDELAAADVVLLVGDFVNVDTAEDAANLVTAVQQFNPTILAVPGNWEKDHVGTYLTGKAMNLDRRHLVLDHITFVGVGASLKSPMTTPNEIAESEFEQYLGEASQGLDLTATWVLVCHEPPCQTICDRAAFDLHVGSKAVRAFIEKAQPAICFTGHIHEGVGIEHIGRTQVVNPGPLWQGHYAYAEVDEHTSWVEIRRCPGAE